MLSFSDGIQFIGNLETAFSWNSVTVNLYVLLFFSLLEAGYLLAPDRIYMALATVCTTACSILCPVCHTLLLMLCSHNHRGRDTTTAPDDEQNVKCSFSINRNKTVAMMTTQILRYCCQRLNHSSNKQKI